LRSLNADLAFIISLKRSALIFSYPQAGYPICWHFWDIARARLDCPLSRKPDIEPTSPNDRI
jgi:hypothetical protein